MILHNLPKDNPELKEKLEKYATLFNKQRKLENELWKINREIEIGEKEAMPKKDLNQLYFQKENILVEKSKIIGELEIIEKQLKAAKVPLERYITKGLPPSNTVEIPVIDGVSQTGRRGLDLEAMLKGMVDVTKNEEGYDLYKLNCSAAVATVIHGGIPEPDKELRKRFKTEGFLGLATPQTIHQAALRGQHYLYTAHLKKPPGDILERFVNFLKEIAEKFQSKPKKPEPS